MSRSEPASRLARAATVRVTTHALHAGSIAWGSTSCHGAGSRRSEAPRRRSIILRASFRCRVNPITSAPTSDSHATMCGRPLSGGAARRHRPCISVASRFDRLADRRGWPSSANRSRTASPAPCTILSSGQPAQHRKSVRPSRPSRIARLGRRSSCPGHRANHEFCPACFASSLPAISEAVMTLDALALLLEIYALLWRSQLRRARLPECRTLFRSLFPN